MMDEEEEEETKPTKVKMSDLVKEVKSKIAQPVNNEVVKDLIKNKLKIKEKVNLPKLVNELKSNNRGESKFRTQD